MRIPYDGEVYEMLALGRIAICDREKSFFHCESIVLQLRLIQKPEMVTLLSFLFFSFFTGNRNKLCSYD